MLGQTEVLVTESGDDAVNISVFSIATSDGSLLNGQAFVFNNPDGDQFSNNDCVGFVTVA